VYSSVSTWDPTLHTHYLTASHLNPLRNVSADKERAASVNMQRAASLTHSSSDPTTHASSRLVIQSLSVFDNSVKVTLMQAHNHTLSHYIAHSFNQSLKHSCISRLPSTGMLRSVTLVRTGASEEVIASIIRVTRIGKLGKLAVTSSRSRY
jgi:hypothetical protein